MQVIFVLILLPSFLHAQSVEVLKAINSSASKIERLRLASPGYTKKETVQESNDAFLKRIESTSLKQDYEKIKNELAYFQNQSLDEVNKAYLKKMLEDEKKQTSEMIKKLGAATSDFLKANVVISEVKKAETVSHAVIKDNTREQKEERESLKNLKVTESNQVLKLVKNDDEENLHQAVSHLHNENTEKYKPKADDSIFEIITKGYIRSYPKLKKIDE